MNLFKGLIDLLGIGKKANRPDAGNPESGESTLPTLKEILAAIQGIKLNPPTEQRRALPPDLPKMLPILPRNKASGQPGDSGKGGGVLSGLVDRLSGLFGKLTDSLASLITGIPKPSRDGHSPTPGMDKPPGPPTLQPPSVNVDSPQPTVVPPPPVNVQPTPASITPPAPINVQPPSPPTVNVPALPAPITPPPPPISFTPPSESATTPPPPMVVPPGAIKPPPPPMAPSPLNQVSQPTPTNEGEHLADKTGGVLSEFVENLKAVVGELVSSLSSIITGLPRQHIPQSKTVRRLVQDATACTNPDESTETTRVLGSSSDAKREATKKNRVRQVHRLEWLDCLRVGVLHDSPVRLASSLGLARRLPRRLSSYLDSRKGPTRQIEISRCIPPRQREHSQSWTSNICVLAWNWVETQVAVVARWQAN